MRLSILLLALAALFGSGLVWHTFAAPEATEIAFPIESEAETSTEDVAGESRSPSSVIRPATTYETVSAERLRGRTLDPPVPPPR